jgi:TolB-like protein
MTTACATGPGGESSDKRSGLSTPSTPIIVTAETFRNAVILDFYEERDVKMGDPYTCPLTGLAMKPGGVDEGAGAAVADLFRSSLARRGFAVISPEETRKIAGKLMSGGRYTLSQALAVGRELEADLVVLGIVARYEERIGGRFSVDRPASVAYSTAVITVADGRVVWKSRFDKAQKDLLSDVLDIRTFFKGGMTWQTADQLAGIGVEDMLDQAAIRPFVKPGRGD